MTLDATTKRLDELLPLVNSCPTPKGLNYAAGLLIHRCRLQIFEDGVAESGIEQLIPTMATAKQRAQAKIAMVRDLWKRTQLMKLQEHVNFLKSESRMQASKFQNELGIQQNLPLATKLLEHSREISPLQPLVHLRLAQVGSIVGDLKQPDVSIKRTLAIAPTNATYRKLSGLYYIQSSRPKMAAEQFRKYLELQPANFSLVMDIATGRTNRFFEPIPAEMIRDVMLPEDAKILFRYAQTYETADPEQQQMTL